MKRYTPKGNVPVHKGLSHMVYVDTRAPNEGPLKGTLLKHSYPTAAHSSNRRAEGDGPTNCRISADEPYEIGALGCNRAQTCDLQIPLA